MTTNTGGGIVQSAHEDAGLCSVGQSISTAQMTRGLARLNDYMSLLATQGVKFWLNKNVGPIALVAGQPSYRIGPTGPAIIMARPLQVTQAWFLYTASGQRQPLTVMAKSQYERLSNTTNQGALASYYVDKQETYFDIFVWNTPDVTIAGLGSVYVAVRESAPQPTISADTTGFPDEWRIALRWGLAADLAVTQPEAVVARCERNAGMYKEMLEGFDVEDAPVEWKMDPIAYGGGRAFR